MSLLVRFLAPALALVCLAAAEPASAQDVFSDFFGSVFGGRRAPRPQPIIDLRPKHKHKPAPAAAPTPDATVTAPAAPAAPPSFFIAVLGDSQAGLLAQGLREAFAADPRVSVLDKSREDTGLVRDDFYDWRGAAKSLLDGPDHIDIAVIEIGINDNQKLRLPDKTSLEPLSKPFNEAYAKRVEDLAGLFRDKHVPLVWVGLPIMRSERMTNAALVFNDIDKQYAGAAGAHFVDLWEAFSDVNSAYRASGPDVNGAIVRLRMADGVHFNKVGARKAAYFVEPEVRRALEAKLQPQTPAPETPPTVPANPEPAAPAPETPAAPPPKPLAGRIEPLTDPSIAPGGALAALPAHGAPPPKAEAAAVQPGRADDFRWQGK